MTSNCASYRATGGDRRTDRSPSLTFSGSIVGGLDMAVMGSSVPVDAGAGPSACDRAHETCKQPNTRARTATARSQLTCEQFRSHQVWAIAAKALRATSCPICSLNVDIRPSSRILDRGRTISPEPAPSSDPGLRHKAGHTNLQPAGENRSACGMTEADSSEGEINRISNHDSTSRRARSRIGRQYPYLAATGHRIAPTPRRPS